MTSQWCNRNRTHSWYSELNPLRNVYLGIFTFWKLTEWRRFVTYLWNDPRKRIFWKNTIFRWQKQSQSTKKLKNTNHGVKIFSLVQPQLTISHSTPNNKQSILYDFKTHWLLIYMRAIWIVIYMHNTRITYACEDNSYIREMLVGVSSAHVCLNTRRISTDSTWELVHCSIRNNQTFQLLI